MSWQGVEFRISIQLNGPEYSVTLTAPRIHGAATTTFNLDPQSDEWRNYCRQIISQSTGEQFFKTIGTKLFEAAFPAQHETTYEINYQPVRENAEDRILRVQLRLFDEEINDLPWECLFNPVAKQWLAANPLTPLSRYVDAQVPPPLKLEPPLKLLIVTAEPETFQPVGAEAEIEAVRKSLGPLLRNKLVVAKLLPHATRRSLARALTEFHPHVFHFVGHGERTGQTGTIVLEGPKNSPDRLQANTLCELLQHTGHLRVAVLNACETKPTAHTLAKAGIAAIGMLEKIRSEAAIPFSRSFYEALAGSAPLDLAVNQARFAIRVECGGDRRDWCLPIVFLPAGRSELFEIDRSVGLVRGTTDPSSTSTSAGNKPASKATPEILVSNDSKQRNIHGTLNGDKPSLLQRASGKDTVSVQRKSQSAAAMGFLVVTSDRPQAQLVARCRGTGKTSEIGQISKLGRVGPVRLAPGDYLVTASWHVRGHQPPTTATANVLIQEGKTSQVQLTYPLTSPLEIPRFTKILTVLGAAVVLLVILVYVIASLLQPNTQSTSSTPPKPNITDNNTVVHPPPPISVAMIDIPAGNLIRGYRDDTVSMRLISKYGLASGAAILEILNNQPKRVFIDPYAIDKREVTNAEYRKFLAAVKTSGDVAWKHSSQPSTKTDHTPLEITWKSTKHNTDDQPVVGIDWYDAYAYAKWAGKQLPTETQWELAARGLKALAYPWGNTFSAQKCNSFEAPTKGTTPAGRFIGDISPYGILEMGGNVSEWTATDAKIKGQKIVRGGDWNVKPGDIYALTFMHRLAPLAIRNSHLGLRCAMDAPAGKSLPPGMVRIPGGMPTLGGETSAMLGALRKMSSAKNAQETLVDVPQDTIPVHAYQISKYEITNAQYRRFLETVEATGDEKYRHPNQPTGKNHTPAHWDNSLLNHDNKPVVGVDWYDAYAFARWAGMRLPTAMEWERAARGDTSNLYPWGDTFVEGKCNGTNAPGENSATPGGTYPDDRSPFGVMDMAGNVTEWIADDYPARTGSKILKGGGWNDSCQLFAIIYLRSRYALRTYRAKATGFRCAQDTPRK